MGRELIRARFGDRLHQASKIMTVLSKIFSERGQELGMRRLDGPWRRWGFGRILPLEVETERRVDNAASHQLRPEQVDCRSRELRMRSQLLRIRLTLANAGGGCVALAIENEC